ncbi:hypothetical protein BCR42DRAFT_407312 [Absidia repens]|uniref:Inner centromere protein ARK-binding domain-containing protein n=1 Tax=Absidia repens TaxID=90262 RepID=A0A1X2IS10_9FUNG|nr:hypothetical protein BCR42DRAFT_407312 [Absidia repens]
MVVPDQTQLQSKTWPQQQELKWQTLAANKMNQLDFLFQDHLNWFRTHKTAESLIATRRTLSDENTTEKEPSKRARFNNLSQDQLDSQENDIDFETYSKEYDTKANSFSTTTTITTTTIVSGASDTITQEKHLPTTRDTLNDNSPDYSVQESTRSPSPAPTTPPTPPAKISRESLLRHFEQEEKKHGRYGLRNRSLGNSVAASSSKPSTIGKTPEQQRRKTIDCANNDNDDFSFTLAVDETIKATPAINNISTPVAATDNTSTPMPATSSAINTTQSVLSPSEESNTPPTTTKDLQHRTYSQEEQIDDEVLLLPRPNNSSSSASLKDGPSRLDQHSILSVDSNSNRQNNSLIANESYSFSSIFSFKRASSSALESSILYDDLKTSSNSSDSKTYTPKRHTDYYHARPSRLTFTSSSSQSKGKASSSTSLGTATRSDGQTNSSSPDMLPKHRSYTPGQPWTATPVRASFLSSSPVNSESLPKRNTSRSINASQSSSNKKPSKANQGIKQGQKGPDQTKESQSVNDPTTDETSEPTPEPTEVFIPSWASHPELDKLLQEQIKFDADKIFGKMPPLQVSQIVKMGH